MAHTQNNVGVANRRGRSGTRVVALVATLAVVIAVLAVGATAHATLPQVDPSTVPTGNLVANNRVSTALTIAVAEDAEHSLPDGSEVFIRHVVLPAGGSTGWHTHPGPVVATIVSGSLMLYDGEDTSCTGAPYDAGQGFIDPGFGHNHLARNEGTAPAEFYATYILPPDAGDTLAVPATGPSGCIVQTPTPVATAGPTVPTPAAAILPSTGSGGGSSSVMTWPLVLVALGLAAATFAAFVARPRVGR